MLVVIRAPAGFAPAAAGGLRQTRAACSLLLPGRRRQTSPSSLKTSPRGFTSQEAAKRGDHRVFYPPVFSQAFPPRCPLFPLLILSGCDIALSLCRDKHYFPDPNRSVVHTEPLRHARTLDEAESHLGGAQGTKITPLAADAAGHLGVPSLAALPRPSDRVRHLTSCTPAVLPRPPARSPNIERRHRTAVGAADSQERKL
jgi:hypothetical protein